MNVQTENVIALVLSAQECFDDASPLDADNPDAGIVLPLWAYQSLQKTHKAISPSCTLMLWPYEGDCADVALYRTRNTANQEEYWLVCSACGDNLLFTSHPPTSSQTEQFCSQHKSCSPLRTQS